LNIPLLPAAAAAAAADTFASTADRTRCIHVAVMPSRTGVVPPRAGQARPSLPFLGDAHFVPAGRTISPLSDFKVAGGGGHRVEESKAPHVQCSRSVPPREAARRIVRYGVPPPHAHAEPRPHI
jgi:hypothetical protein